MVASLSYVRIHHGAFSYLFLYDCDESRTMKLIEMRRHNILLNSTISASTRQNSRTVRSTLNRVFRCWPVSAHDCPACVIDNDFTAPQSCVFRRSFQLISQFYSNIFLSLKRKEKHYADPRVLSWCPHHSGWTGDDAYVHYCSSYITPPPLYKAIAPL